MKKDLIEFISFNVSLVSRIMINSDENKKPKEK